MENKQSAEFDQRIRAAQGKVEMFVTACGGTVTLRALRLYIETQERDDAIISRALVAPDGPVEMRRTETGSPFVLLRNPVAATGGDNRG